MAIQLTRKEWFKLPLQPENGLSRTAFTTDVHNALRLDVSISLMSTILEKQYYKLLSIVKGADVKQVMRLHDMT